MGDGGERLGQAIRCHIDCCDVLELQLTKGCLLLDLVIVDVDMLASLVVSFLLSELDCWQIVDV